MDRFPKVHPPHVLLPEAYPEPFRVVSFSADPDHFVVKWLLESPRNLPNWPVLTLGNLAAKSLLMAALNGREEGPMPDLISLKTDYFDCRLPLKGVVAEVDLIHQSRGVLSLEAYLYHETEKLLAKAAATFTTPISH